MSSLKLCTSCLKELSSDHFYRKGDRYETICKPCKVEKKRQRRKRKRDEKAAEIEAANIPDVVVENETNPSDQKPVTDEKVVASGEGETYKEFKYPDGRILRLTKSEWDEIVRHFIWLDNQATFLHKSGRIKKKEWIKVQPRKVGSNQSA